MEAEEHWIDVRPAEGGLRLEATLWPGEKRPFVLLHGLSSNQRTWHGVARILAAAGHPVVTLNQRGHGRSDKPAQGYGFEVVTDDLARALDLLGFDRPVLVGQSWGGNVVVAFAARFPGRVHGLGLVDGGMLDLQAKFGPDWEPVASALRPPALAGMTRTELMRMLVEFKPTWDSEGVEATLGNFETLDDGTVRPWLNLDRHMQILRALWEQRPSSLFSKVREPVLLCLADEDDPEWTAAKQAMAEVAMERLAIAQMVWFPHTDHDIHVQRPRELAALFLECIERGIWADPAGGHKEGSP